MQTQQTVQISENASQGRRINEHEAADFLGLTVACLRDWRIRKKGPAWMKFESAVRYDTRMLELYLDSCKQIA